MGTYFIRTTLKKSEEETIWKLYRTINEVEDAFKTLKSDLNTRPNYHQLEKNIEAHINLSVLSYNIINMIRHRLKLKDLHYGWSRIRSIMSTQHITLQAINGRDKKTVWIKSCTRPQANVYEIYAALNYKNMPYYRKSIIVE